MTRKKSRRYISINSALITTATLGYLEILSLVIHWGYKGSDIAGKIHNPR